MISSPTAIDPPMTITFDGTEQGVAWRPGEIWVGNWLMPMEIFDESGHLLGTIDFAAIRSEGLRIGALAHLAFDRGQLLVGNGGQLAWYDIH